VRKGALAASVLLATAAAGVTLASKRGSAFDAGPLNRGQRYEAKPGGKYCVPTSVGGVVTASADVLQNDRGRPIRIDKLELANAVNMELVSAELVPIVRSTLGSWTTYPPPEQALRDAGIDWKTRRPAREAQLRSAVQEDLIFQLRPLGPGQASADGADIYYSDGKHQYRYRTSTAFLVMTTPEKCF
jgi:hypothetical protein